MNGADMSETEKIDRGEQRREAEARLARSRPARQAAAAAHAARMGLARTHSSSAQSVVFSRVEEKILDAANEILATRGGEGQRLADMIRSFIGSHSEP